MKKSLFTFLGIVCILGILLVAGCKLDNNGPTGNVVGPTNNESTAPVDDNQTTPPTTIPAVNETKNNMSNNSTQITPTPSTTGETSFVANLSGKQETPATTSTAAGRVTATLNGNTLTLTGNFDGLGSDVTASHIHYGGVSYPGPVVFSITINGNEMTTDSSTSNETAGSTAHTNGTLSFTGTLTDSQIIQLQNGFYYVNVHSTQFPNGEIRGQLLAQGAPGIRETSMATTQSSNGTTTITSLPGTMGSGSTTNSSSTGTMGTGSAGGSNSGTGSSGSSY